MHFIRRFWLAGLSVVLGAATAPQIRADEARLGPDPSRWRESLAFQTHSPRGHVGAPALVGGLLVVETPFPHTVFALDPTRPGAPPLWRYAPEPDTRAAGVACCGGVVAGPATDGDLVVLNTADGHTVALKALDGEVVWDVMVARLEAGEVLREAPLIAAGKVFVGESGDDNGARGWIAALDERTGREI